MNQITENDIKLWVANMLKRKGVKDYKLEIEGGTSKGDGYLGEVCFVTVSSTEQDFDLVVKSAKQSDELRKQTPIKEAYDREIFVYTKVLPIFEEFQKIKAIEKPFSNYPECYYVCIDDMKESLILQNLKPFGFELHDRKTPMNLNHIHTIFTNYGRFHALSLAIRDQRPSVFKSLTKNMTDILAKWMEQAQMVQSFQHNFREIKQVLEESHPDILKKYEGFEKEMQKVMCKFGTIDDPSFVILHGDCWNNNFMFQYDSGDKSKPKSMNFLDFQLTRVGSPVLDLSYCLYCCTDGKVLKDFDFILQAYHSSLSDSLTELGSDVEDILPLNKLREHWKEFGKFGMVMALFILKISLCDQSEAPDFAASAEKGEGFEKNLFFEIKDKDVYNSRIRDVFVHYAEKFL